MTLEQDTLDVLHNGDPNFPTEIFWATRAGERVRCVKIDDATFALTHGSFEGSPVILCHRDGWGVCVKLLADPSNCDVFWQFEVEFRD